MTSGIPKADPHLCPDCQNPIGAEPRCPHCDLPLRGPVALDLWNTTVLLNQVAAERERLLGALRGRPQPPPAARPQVPRWEPLPPAPPRPRREWDAKRVQNLLLGLGVLLLVVAAVIFAVVAWGRLGIEGRALVLLTATAATGWGAYEVHRRELTATAEALGSLTVALLLLDAYAVRRLGVAGLDEPRGAWFWAGAVAAIAAICAGYAAVLPLRVLRWSAAAGAQLPLPIVLLDADLAPSTAAMALTAQSAAVVAAATTVRIADVARIARAGAALAALVALPLALADAYGDRARPGAASLAVLAAAAALAAWLHREDASVRDVTAGAATALLLTAVAAVGRAELTGDQLPALLAASGLLAVVASAALPEAWRRGPAAAGSAGVALPVLAVAEHALAGLFGPYRWLEHPWTLEAGTSARDALTPNTPWGGTVVVLVVLLVAAATALLAGELRGRRDAVALPVGLTVALAVLLVPLGLAWSYPAAVAWDVAAGAALLLPRRRALYAAGLVVLATSVAWSLASETATLAAVAGAAVLLAAVAVFDPATSYLSAGLAAALGNGWVVALALSRETPLDRTGFLLALAGAACVAGGLVARRAGLAVAAAGGVAYALGVAFTATDAGWLSWSLLAGAVAAAGVSVVTREARPVSAALACAWTYTYAVSIGTPVDRAGFLAALTACAAVALGRYAGDSVEVVGATAYAAAAVPAASDLGWLSWTLAAGGLTALAVALRPERREVAWVGGALLSAWSWVRLWVEDVRAPEAYAAPVAVTALVLGHLRRRADETVGSWAAYGTGLSAAFGPSLLVALDDPGLTRPLTLGLAALAAVLWGARERLQAPLVLGGITLALDAGVQVAPYVGGLPRWIPIGAAGVLLVVVGVTFEQRRRDFDRLRDTFEAMT